MNRYLYSTEWAKLVKDGPKWTKVTQKNGQDSSLWSNKSHIAKKCTMDNLPQMTETFDTRCWGVIYILRD